MKAPPQLAALQGKPLLASDSTQAPLAVHGGNYAEWFAPGGTGFTRDGADPTPGPLLSPAPTYTAGIFGKPNYPLQVPRAVVFVNAASQNYKVVFASALGAYDTLASSLFAGLSGTGLELTSGWAAQDLTAAQFGSADFPDGYHYANNYGGYVNNSPGSLSPGDRDVSSWVWALSMGLPGDPALLQGGDVLLFLVAWCDFRVFTNLFSGPVDAPYVSYHDGTYYYGDIYAQTVTQPTAKFTAHRNRLASLVAKLDRYRAVVIRPTNLTYDSSGFTTSGAQEAHFHAHFAQAINGTGPYAGIGLSALGVELMEVTGPPSEATLEALVRAHFNV